MKNLLRKGIWCALASILLVMASLGLQNMADESKVWAEEDVDNYIATAKSLNWKIGSMATASWEAVSGATYYSVEVNVSDGKKSLGKMTTGTSDTKIDLQQEIQTIYRNSRSTVNAVFVTYSITAACRDEMGVVTSVSIPSRESEEWIYVVTGTYDVTLSAPVNVTLGSNNVVSWDMFRYPNGVYYYQINYAIKTESGWNNNTYTYYTTAADRMNKTHYSRDINAAIMERAAALGITGKVETKVTVKACTSKSLACNGLNFKDSPASTETASVQKTIQNMSPSNVVLNIQGTQGTISWTVAPYVAEDTYYVYRCTLKNDAGKTYSMEEAVKASLFTGSVDITKLLSNAYYYGGFTDENLEVTAYVHSSSMCNTYYSTYYSSYYVKGATVNAASPATYRLQTHYLENPSDLALSDDLVATWTNPSDADQAYRYYIKYTLTDLVDSSKKYSSTTSVTPGTPNASKTLNLNSNIMDAARNYGFTKNAFNIQISVRAELSTSCKVVGDTVYRSAKEYTNSADVVKLQPVYATPSWTTGLTQTWDAIEGQMNGGKYYAYYQLADATTSRTGYLNAHSVNTSATKYTADLTTVVQKAMVDCSMLDRDVKVSTYVLTYVKAGEESVEAIPTCSGEVTWKVKKVILPTPAGLKLATNMKLSWTGVSSLASVPSASYEILYTMTDKAGKISSYSYSLKYANTKTNADLFSTVQSAFFNWGYIVGNEADVSFAIRSYVPSYNFVGQTYYVSSPYSSAQSATFDGRKHVEQIILSPLQPVVNNRGTVAIGKTIYPDDAYYTTIKWTTPNKTYATVNTVGVVSGKKAGSTSVTATIDDATASVPVKVYEIITNAEQTNKTIIEKTAGRIVDSICNDEIPNVEGTDIKEEDIPQLKETLKACILTNGEIHADLYVTYLNEDFADMKKNVQARDGHYYYMGSYHSEVLMYYVGADGIKHFFAHIYQLDGNLTITAPYNKEFEIPKLPAGYYNLYECVQKQTVQRIDYKMVREGTDAVIALNTPGGWLDTETFEVYFNNIKMTAMRSANGREIDVVVPKDLAPATYQVKVLDGHGSWIDYGTIERLSKTDPNYAYKKTTGEIIYTPKVLQDEVVYSQGRVKATMTRNVKKNLYTFTTKTDRTGDFSLVYEELPIVPTFKSISPKTSHNKYEVTVSMKSTSAWVPGEDFGVYFNGIKMDASLVKNYLKIKVPADFTPGEYAIKIDNEGFSWSGYGTYTCTQYVPPIPTFKKAVKASGVNNVTNKITLTSTGTWGFENDFAVYFDDKKMDCTIKNAKVTVTIPAGMEPRTYKITVVNETAVNENVGTYESIQYVPPTPKFKKITPISGTNNKACTVTMTMDTGWTATSDFKVYFGTKEMKYTLKGSTVKVTVPKDFAIGSYDIYVYNEGVKTKLDKTFTWNEYVPPVPTFTKMTRTEGVEKFKYTTNLYYGTGWAVDSDFAVYFNGKEMPIKIKSKYVTITIPAGTEVGEYTIKVRNEGVTHTIPYKYTSKVYVPPVPTFKKINRTSNENNAKTTVKLTYGDGWSVDSDFKLFFGGKEVGASIKSSYLTFVVPRGTKAGTYDLKVYNEGVLTTLPYTYTVIEHVAAEPVFSSMSSTSSLYNKKVTIKIHKEGDWAYDEFRVTLGDIAIDSSIVDTKTSHYVRVTIPKGIARGTYDLIAYNYNKKTVVGTYTIY